jgi:hypothetical protein
MTGLDLDARDQKNKYTCLQVKFHLEIIWIYFKAKCNKNKIIIIIIYEIPEVWLKSKYENDWLIDAVIITLLRYSNKYSYYLKEELNNCQCCMRYLRHEKILLEDIYLVTFHLFIYLLDLK